MAEESMIELLLKLKDAMSPGVKKAEAELSKFEKSLQQFEESARHFKAVFYAGLAFEGMAFGIGEALKQFAEPAIAFEEAQQNLARATGLSTEQLGAFKDEAMALSEQLPQSAIAITNAEADLTRMLGSGAKAMETIGIATQFATATGLDMATSAQLLASAYENLGDKSAPIKQGFEQIADILTMLQNKFSTSKDNGDMMVRSFAHLAGAAEIMGVNTVQAAAALGVLNQSGLGGGRGAGTYVEQMLMGLGKLDRDGIPSIQKFGIALAGAIDGHGQFHMDLLGTLHNMLAANPMRLEAYLKSLGDEGGALELLLQHYGALQYAVDELGHAHGATATLAQEMNKGWQDQLTDLGNTYSNLEQSLGEVFVPMLIEIAHLLQPIADWFRHLVDAHPWIAEIGIGFMMLVGAGLLLGGTLLILTSTFGALWKSIGVVTAAFEAFGGVMGILNGLWAVFDALVVSNPIGLIAAGLIFAANEIYVHWDAVKKFFTEGWGRFTGIGMILACVEKLIELAPSIEAFGKHFIDWIVKGIESGMGELEHAMHTVWETMKKFLPFTSESYLTGANAIPAVRQAVTAAAWPVAAAMGGLNFAEAPIVAGAAGGGHVINMQFHAHRPGDVDATLEEFRRRTPEFRRDVEWALSDIGNSNQRKGY